MWIVHADSFHFGGVVVVLCGDIAGLYDWMPDNQSLRLAQ